MKDTSLGEAIEWLYGTDLEMEYLRERNMIEIEREETFNSISKSESFNGIRGREESRESSTEEYPWDK